MRLKTHIPQKRRFWTDMEFERWYNRTDRHEGKEVAMRRHNRIVSLHRDRYARALYRSALFGSLRGQ